MIFHKNKKRLLETVYQPIEAEYNAIHATSSKPENNSDFPFANLIECSRSFACRHPYLAYLNKQLNLLAREWDSTLWENRKVKGELSIPLLTPRHSFLLVPSKQSSSASAKLYNKTMPPDHRLVAISVPGVTRQLLACIYHEMGHFIGYRNRQARLADYFIPILIDKILTLVYEMTCRRYSGGVPVPSKHIVTYTRYSEDMEYNINVRTYAQQMIQCLQSIRKDILSCINKEYQELTDSFVSTAFASTVVEEQQLAISIKMGFFASIHGLMIRVLVNVLSNVENLQRWEAIVAKTLSGQVSQSKTDIWQHITEAINSINTELAENIEAFSLPLWYEECEQYLEEPAADIFMLKMIGFSCKEYIDLIIEQLQNVIGSTSIERIERALNKPVIHQRVISVALALDAQSSDFVDSESSPISRNNAEYQQRRAAQKRLLSMYQCARKLSELPEAVDGDFFDPTPYLFKYVNDLWHDQRYSDFCQSHRSLLETILNCTLMVNRFNANRKVWTKLAKE